MPNPKSTQPDPIQPEPAALIDEWGDEWSDDDTVGLGPAPGVGGPDDPRRPLSAGQARMAAAIHGLTTKEGYPPSVRELQRALGNMSPNGVACHLKPLIIKGYLNAKPHQARTLKLIPATKPPASVAS